MSDTTDTSFIDNKKNTNSSDSSDSSMSTSDAINNSGGFFFNITVQIILLSIFIIFFGFPMLWSAKTAGIFFSLIKYNIHIFSLEQNQNLPNSVENSIIFEGKAYNYDNDETSKMINSTPEYLLKTINDEKTNEFIKYILTITLAMYENYYFLMNNFFEFTKKFPDWFNLFITPLAILPIMFLFFNVINGCYGFFMSFYLLFNKINNSTNNENDANKSYSLLEKIGLAIVTLMVYCTGIPAAILALIVLVIGFKILFNPLYLNTSKDDKPITFWQKLGDILIYNKFTITIILTLFTFCDLISSFGIYVGICIFIVAFSVMLSGWPSIYELKKFAATTATTATTDATTASAINNNDQGRAARGNENTNGDNAGSQSVDISHLNQYLKQPTIKITTPSAPPPELIPGLSDSTRITTNPTSEGTDFNPSAPLPELIPESATPKAEKTLQQKLDVLRLPHDVKTKQEAGAPKQRKSRRNK